MSYKGRRTTEKPRERIPTAPSVRGEVVPVGFPTDVLDQICTLIMSGESIESICQQPGMPSKQTVMKWLRTDQSFMDQYIDCARVRAIVDADKIQDIADGKTLIEIEKVTRNEEGEEITTFLSMPEDINRSKLRIDAIKWRAERLLSQVYGNKIQNEHKLTGDLAELLKGADNAGHELPR